MKRTAREELFSEGQRVGLLTVIDRVLHESDGQDEMISDSRQALSASQMICATAPLVPNAWTSSLRLPSSRFPMSIALSDFGGYEA